MTEHDDRLVNNTAWLAGYDLYAEGGPIPWDWDTDSHSARLGWLAARQDADAKAAAR